MLLPVACSFAAIAAFSAAATDTQISQPSTGAMFEGDCDTWKGNHHIAGCVQPAQSDNAVSFGAGSQMEPLREVAEMPTHISVVLAAFVW